MRRAYLSRTMANNFCAVRQLRVVLQVASALSNQALVSLVRAMPPGHTR